MIEQWMSDELRELSPHLTGQQWAGVIKIVKAELAGRSLTALLISPDRPCATSTYYGRWNKKKQAKSQPGWVDNPSFTQALEWARRDYRTWLMESGTSEAMLSLSKAAAPSARELERQVVGDLVAVEALSQAMDVAVKQGDDLQIAQVARMLGDTQLSQALPALVRALEHEWEPETYGVLVEAMGRIASPLNVDRQKAAMGILDRLDDTATKAVIQETSEREQRISFDLEQLPTEILQLLAHGGDGEGTEGSGQGGTEETA